MAMWNRRVCWRLAPGALAALAACDEHAPIDAEPSRAPGASVALASSSLKAPVTLTCGASETHEVVELSLTSDRQRLEPDPMDCGGEAQALRASLEAWFDDTASLTATAFSRALHIRGTAHASCVGSITAASHLAFTWSSTLSLPAGNHRVLMSAMSDADRSTSCEVRLAGEQADPIRAERSRLALAFVTGPADLEVSVACPGFTASTCFGNPVDPLTTSETLDVFIEVAPTE